MKTAVWVPAQGSSISSEAPRPRYCPTTASARSRFHPQDVHELLHASGAFHRVGIGVQHLAAALVDDHRHFVAVAAHAFLAVDLPHARCSCLTAERSRRYAVTHRHVIDGLQDPVSICCRHAGSPFPLSWVHTLPLSPNSESLARRRASSSCRTFWMQRIGPKVSSDHDVHAVVDLGHYRRLVVEARQVRVALPPMRMVAPLARASSTWRSMMSICRSQNTAPTSSSQPCSGPCAMPCLSP